MDIRILDLDGSLPRQPGLLSRYRPGLFDLLGWGPVIRLGCRFGRFRRFEQALADFLGLSGEDVGTVTLYGSGDFHHVSLALLRRISSPCNLLVLDNHPDWMRGVPFLHCGTWLYHAARLPHVRRIFHVGGDVDFDNSYRWMAPWSLLRRGKITVIPGVRQFRRGRWGNVPNQSLRGERGSPLTAGRLEELLEPLRGDLGKFPLYISLDKDVMKARESVVNWDSGHLTLAEVTMIVEGFLQTASGKLIGMDVVGDWSEVKLRGLLRRFLHWTEHPALKVSPAEADRRNEQTNLALLELIQAIGRRDSSAA
jgi:hypothetical protein